MESNARQEALRAALRRGLFDTVVLGQSFWRQDRADAESVHVDAREKFDQLCRDVASGGARSLLLIGETGAGKTHLLRAMRAKAAAAGGLCAYAQFNAQGGDYLRHFLKRLVDSLGERTEDGGRVASGFERLLAVWLDRTPKAAERLAVCGDENGEESERHRAVGAAAEMIIDAMQLEESDLSVVIAVLYASVDGFGIRTRQRARHFLSAEPLSELDRSYVPELPAQSGDVLRDPAMISLSRAAASAGEAPFVYFFDQAEALWQQGPGAASDALQAIAAFLDAARNTVVVIAVEKSQHQIGYLSLPRFLRDRFDNGLQSELSRERSENEVRAILEARLRTALLDAGLAPDPRNPLDPLPFTWPQDHARRQTRAVLAEARAEVERQLGETPSKPSTDAGVVEQLDTRWKAALDAVADVPEDDVDLLDLLGWAAGTARFAGVSAKPGAVTKAGVSTYLDLVHGADGATCTTRVFIMSGASQGGRLLRRINDAIDRRGGHRAVAVRLESFPANPATQSAKQLQALISPDGTRVRPTADELRRLAAFKEFVGAESDNPGFVDWAKQASIIEGCESVAAILGVVGGSGWQAEIPASEETVPRAVATTSVTEATHETDEPSISRAKDRVGGSVKLGLDERNQEVELEPAALLKHAAVLGGSGSGKTTFILNVVEELICLGVPAVLVDRKGDFASYAAEAVWLPTGNVELDRRRNELRQRLEVAVYTPGKSTGRPLMLKLLPPDIGDLSEEDRREATRSSADALADMIGLKSGAKDVLRREVLAQAVGQSAEAGGATLDLAGLVELLHEGAPGLENLLSYLDPKARLRKELAQRLEALRLGRQELFAATGEPLDFAALLSGRTGIRMSVVSLAFMPEVADQQFFVSRLLAEARRHCRRSPSATLQGVLVLDEADLYMPAQSNPATKAPLLDLLRRARSGGIGIILGTQSPGDLDYKGRDNIATWALGRLQTRPAIDKVSFAAEGSSFDLDSLLPSFKTGQFLVRSENVHALIRGHRSQIETRQLRPEEILAICRH